MDSETANHLIESAGNDIRQVINNLQMWNANPEDIKKSAGVKDDKVMINNFEAASRLLNSAKGQILDQKHPRFRDKMDLYFIDYDWVPMLMQENYLKAMEGRKD